MTDKQKKMFKLLKRASGHYQLLLYLICSSSFKAYFDMIVALFGEHSLLPKHNNKKLYYDPFAKKTFRSDTAVVNNVEEIGEDVGESDEVEAYEKLTPADFVLESVS